MGQHSPLLNSYSCHAQLLESTVVPSRQVCREGSVLHVLFEDVSTWNLHSPSTSTRHHPPVHAGDVESEEDLISEINKLEADELTASPRQPSRWRARVGQVHLQDSVGEPSRDLTLIAVSTV